MGKDLIKMQHSLTVGSLGAYVQWVNQIPVLTPEEERDCAEKLSKFNDLEAARKLIMSHLRFVVKIARSYSGYGLAENDLIQEGNIGLMKAVKRFDPNVGVRLVTFAVHWIRAEIHEFVLRNWRIVKIATTKAQRKLFFNLRKMAKARGWFSDAEVAMVAEELKVKPAEVRQMEARLNNYDQAFDSYGSDDDGSLDWSAPANYLEDHSTNPENLLESRDWSNNQYEQLHTALNQLDIRSQDILKRRWLDENKPTLHDLAAEYSVSAERIRQLEKAAMKKLQAAISH